MTRDEHTKIIQELLTYVNVDKQATASELLTNLSTDYEETLTSLETSKADVDKLTINNETLRDVNAKLFLKVGQTDEKIKQESNHVEDINTDEENVLSYDDLFGEKGELL
jgi:hypothetical protein